MLAATGAFFLTREVAASNRRISVDDAAEWYRLGQRALGEGRLDDAVDAFRRATARDRGERTYSLALAHVLTARHDYDAARGLLLSLRDAAPEDPDINLELARLAAAREDATEALRFYHNALYAPWPADRDDARREVRFEMIRFLLARRYQNRAASELMAGASDLPDRPDTHIRVAQLFVAAGDDAHALDQFQRALRAAPDDPAALIGAGQSAFRLGQYALARTSLRRAARAGAGDPATLEIAERVLSDDPLAPRLGMAERRRRLASDVSYVGGRLDACAIGDADLASALDGVARQPAADQDAIEAGVDLVARAARRLVGECRPPAARDRALALISREHEAR